MTLTIRSAIFGAALVVFGCSLGVAVRSATSEPSSFLSEMNMSMMTMDAAMAIHPTGDVDRDFVAMMAPHHQGAIDMAQLELRYGHSEQLRRIAQEIIVDQQQEIVAMQRAIHPAITASEQK
jgi:uncharacterized protein (DUF305 family)